MESTAVYCRPIWNVLEDQGFRLLLVNPVQVKALAGRKSDGRDARRIAEYLEDNRLDASFVPPAEIRDLFETASVKLSSVLSDLMGVSGRRIIEALIGGEESAEILSWKVRGKLRAKEKLVKESLKDCFQAYHRTMLESLYRHYKFLAEQIEIFEKQIARHMEPHEQKLLLLAGIPGVDRIVGWHLIAELGTDLSVFPDADHCASWAGVVPGENESAGKKMSTRCRKGNKFLRRVLAQAAWAASHSKTGYLRAFFHRVKARRGWSKAIMAVAHKILVFAFQILSTNTPYQDLGSSYFDTLQPERTVQRLIQKLQSLGLQVTVMPQQANT